ncbi:MAG: glycosyl transferase [Burkholderiales bacterium RIFCSPLOWO2_02_FULL_57_36]|nr:MAG: glycosyl transferase [Burkholderiales bacterium RIFCSPLOWO2_02_FULL_57_36]
MTHIDIISNADNVGGASRAAYRLYRTLLSTNIKAKMTVCEKKTDDWMVSGPSNMYEKVKHLIRPRIGGNLMRLQRTPNVNPHSANILPSNMAAAINGSDAAIVNLHWIGGETMSIEDLGRIRKPIVWTFHDMWAFCGSEHVVDDGPNARWREGYYPDNRPPCSSGLDIDRYTWNRKRRAWKNPIHVVTPSRWLADCVKQSALMKDWPVSVIPNVLDTTAFKPLDRLFSRHALSLPSDKKIILFGAMGGSRSFNKGYDLLIEALKVLSTHQGNILCVVFGQSEPEHLPDIPFPIQWMGHIGDDATLALLYSAADVMIIPSRQENLPQSGTEAHACGCPVVAFNCTGLPEVVDHCVTGYLATPYRPDDLAHGIEWVLEDKERHTNLRIAARKKTENLWSARSVIPAYLNVYELAQLGHRATVDLRNLRVN